MFRTREGIAFRLVTCRGSGTRLERVAGPTEERRGEHADGPCPSVNLSEQEVRRCFEGRLLARAAAVAELLGYTARFPAVFGRSADRRRKGAPHYRHGALLRRIGRRLTDPQVRAVLAEAPEVELVAAAAHPPWEPHAQIEAAVAARVAATLDSAERRAGRGGRGRDDSATP